MAEKNGTGASGSGKLGWVLGAAAGAGRALAAWYFVIRAPGREETRAPLPARGAAPGAAPPGAPSGTVGPEATAAPEPAAPEPAAAPEAAAPEAAPEPAVPE